MNDALWLENLSPWAFSYWDWLASFPVGKPVRNAGASKGQRCIVNFFQYSL